MTSEALIDAHAVRRSAGLVPSSFDIRDVFSFLALVGTFAAVLGMFLISPVALEARGIAYIEAGGGFFSKFHPATPVAAAAFAFRCLAARRPVHVAWRLTTSDTGVLLLLAGVVVAGVFAAIVDKTPISPLGDTFVLPVLVFLLLRDLDARTTRWLAVLVATVLVANAGLAILEFLRGFHLIQAQAPADATDDPTKANGVFSWKADLALDWRAEALLGHPLVNGLVIGGFILCLAAPGAAWIPIAVRAPLLGFQMMSLFCFGARTALVLSMVLATWLILGQVIAALARGARMTARGTAPVVLLIGAVVVAGVILSFSGFLDKTFDRFTNDAGSASTRLTMFELFTPVPLTDLVLHPDKDLVATLQRIYGLEFGIESSWIGLILTYGIIVTVIVMAGILAFWRSVLRHCGRGAITVCFLYLTLVSVTASLSGKTTTFGMAVALVLLFLRRDATQPAGATHLVESSVHGPS